MRLVLESATDCAIVTADLDSAITGWNRGAGNVLGCDESQAGQQVRADKPVRVVVAADERHLRDDAYHPAGGR